MSSGIVTAVNCSGEKFQTAFKYPLRKVNETELHTSPILLLTVEYPQNDKSSPCSSKLLDQSQQNDSIERSENLPYSLLQLGESVVKDISYEGTIELNSNKTHPSYGPVLVIRNESEQEENGGRTPSKASYSEQVPLNNFLFSPLPKSVVCTVMPKDATEKNETNSGSSAGENKGISSLEKYSDLDGYSSGEETVHVISDKPVMCRALASLPVTFLYFGKAASKSESSKGVFAKREIPRKAQFGPMEGVLSPIDSSVEHHHLQLTIESNGLLERLDVSNENTSNWMRYVRQADSCDEQNLILHQVGKNLYFTALRKIMAGEELKAWYSPSYAKSRNLPLVNYGTLNKKGDEICTNNESNLTSVNSVQEDSASKWKCTHCQRVFRSATLFNLHVLTHAADNLEISENCDKIQPISPKDSHLGCSRFKAKRTFICNECSKTFSSNATLASHLRSHASVKMFDCPICKQVFYKVRQLKEHIGSHAVGGVFFCPHCSKKFQEYKHIRNHIRRFHSGKKFVCVHCSKRFSTLDKLKMHHLSHSEIREFSCANCGKQFKRKDKLSVHMKKKHRLCSEMQTTVNSSMNKDKKNMINSRNYSEYVYKCHICVLGFKRRGMLVNHLAQRHPGITLASVPELNLPILKANRDYYCQYCDKIYKSSSKRKAHILKNHPGEKLPLNGRQVSSKDNSEKNETYSQTVGSVTTNPHGCEWCHKQYASKGKLLQHQRKKHPNQIPKSFLHPKRSGTSSLDIEEADSVKEVVEKVTDTELFLPDPLELSEYELSVGDGKFFSDGEFIIDANTLKRAIKGDVLSTDCSPETLAELGQIIETRPDGYFKVFQGPSGITLAHPVEVWDPLSLCLSPPESSNILPSN